MLHAVLMWRRRVLTPIIASAGGFPFAAPVLTWDNTSQRLLIDFDEDSVVDSAVVTVEFYSDAGLTSLVGTGTDTLNGAKILSGILSMVVGLANGTYYARGMITDSPWSDTET